MQHPCSRPCAAAPAAGHTFCYRCLEQHLAHQHNCPACARFLTPDLIYPNFLLSKVRCAALRWRAVLRLLGLWVGQRWEGAPGSEALDAELRSAAAAHASIITPLLHSPRPHQIAKRAHSRALSAAPSARELLTQAVSDLRVGLSEADTDALLAQLGEHKRALQEVQREASMELLMHFLQSSRRARCACGAGGGESHAGPERGRPAASCCHPSRRALLPRALPPPPTLRPPPLLQGGEGAAPGAAAEGAVLPGWRHPEGGGGGGRPVAGAAPAAAAESRRWGACTGGS